MTTLAQAALRGERRSSGSAARTPAIRSRGSSPAIGGRRQLLVGSDPAPAAPAARPRLVVGPWVDRLQRRLPSTDGASTWVARTISSSGSGSGGCMASPASSAPRSARRPRPRRSSPSARRRRSLRDVATPRSQHPLAVDQPVAGRAQHRRQRGARQQDHADDQQEDDEDVHADAAAPAGAPPSRAPGRASPPWACRKSSATARGRPCRCAAAHAERARRERERDAREQQSPPVRKGRSAGTAGRSSSAPPPTTARPAPAPRFADAPAERHRQPVPDAPAVPVAVEDEAMNTPRATRPRPSTSRWRWSSDRPPRRRPSSSPPSRGRAARCRGRDARRGRALRVGRLAGDREAGALGARCVCLPAIRPGFDAGASDPASYCADDRPPSRHCDQRPLPSL